MIPPGHKVALSRGRGRTSRSGATARSSASPRRTSSRAQHVHTHNLSIGAGRARRSTTPSASDYRRSSCVPEAERRTFMGFRRADGRVGTRNYVAVLASVNCSSSATRRGGRVLPSSRASLDALPERRRRDRASPHKGGCGAHIGSDRPRHLPADAGRHRRPPERRRLRHPQPRLRGQPADRHDRVRPGWATDDQPLVLTIQQDGGFREDGRGRHRGGQASCCRAPTRRRASRCRPPSSMVALQCGGSDGWSGVTANPALGVAARPDRRARAARSSSARRPRSTAASTC